MKYLSLCLFSLLSACGLTLLASCAAREPSSPMAQASAPSSEKNAPNVFLHTKAHEEPILRAEAGRLARSGSGLASDLAERCWREEESRPAVREACLLAWSVGNEVSPFLHTALVSAASQSRALTLAAVRKEEPLRELTLGYFIPLLERLQEDPDWVRARAARAWLRYHPNEDARALHVLFSFLNENAASPTPSALRDRFLAAKPVSAGIAEETFRAYCQASVTGIARIRCWRFLSTLALEGTDTTLAQEGGKFLPLPRDPAWILFTRSFPERARLLDRFIGR